MYKLNIYFVEMCVDKFFFRIKQGRVFILRKSTVETGLNANCAQRLPQMGNSPASECAVSRKQYALARAGGYSGDVNLRAT